MPNEQQDDPGGATPMTVLVTGAAGFVGSRVVELLSGTTPHRVLAVDVVDGQRAADVALLPRVEFATVDLRDAAATSPLVASADAVVHLAAVRTQGARSRPRDAHEVNVGTTYDLLTMATEHRTARFVFGSTNTVYGPYQDPDAAPAREDQPWVCRGINLYAATKLASEAYLEAFAGLGGPEYVALRIGPVYGPRVSAGSNSAMALDVLEALDRGERPVVRWAREAVHSFVHVDDVARAVIAALTTTTTGVAVNVVGAPATTEQLCSRTAELYGYDPELLDWTEERNRYQRVSQDRMQQVLGFVPSTTLDEGLQSLIDWHRSRR